MVGLRVRLVLILALVAVSVSACTNSTPTPTVSPLATVVSSLGVPIASTPQVPAPQAGKGTVVGILFDTSKNAPYADRSIYLAKVGKMEPTTPGGSPVLFAELDVVDAPYSQTDANGRFLMQNVEPGDYTLAVWLPNLQQMLLYDSATNANFSVTVKPGKITDMGTLKITMP